MQRVLVPIDATDPEGVKAAVAEAVRIYTQSPVDVVLLNVQHAVNGHVAMFFGERELQELHQAAGADDLAPAEALLRAAKLPWTSHVRVGRSAETIARTARELGCDRVVLGREGSPATLASKVFGSLAQQVRQLLGSSAHCQVIGA
jgi:nucleotide-binding universal stress UspA family protein